MTFNKNKLLDEPFTRPTKWLANELAWPAFATAALLGRVVHSTNHVVG